LKCRDNGTGIPIDDRAYLGQCHATSKIFAFEDISSVRTHGFRGEAISSLCVIGNVTITTRVEGEVTAQTLEFNHDGNIITYSQGFQGKINCGRRQSAAGQRGTTVIVRNLFDALPVRLAQMKKHRVPLGKVKSLMATYALVNEIRFCLQMRRNRRFDWSIPAVCDAMGVAISLFGKEFMKRYTQRTWGTDGITAEIIFPNVEESISLLLSVANLDTLVSDKQLQTHYLYVDNRPISPSRSPAKDLLKLLRESYPRAEKLSSSFIYLNIRCTPGTIMYDCNLDPAKSELVFEHPELVFRMFKEFIDEMFQTRSPSPASVDFFSSAPQKLPSPPPTTPRKVYAFTKRDGFLHDTPSDGLRQTRLDEFIGKVPALQLKRMRRERRSPSPRKDLCSLRSIMGNTDIGGIDLTEGVVSARGIPKQANTPPTPSLSSCRDAGSESRRARPAPLAEIFTPANSDPALQTPSKTPRRKRSRSLRTPKPPDRPFDTHEETPLPIQVKISESPHLRNVDVETTLNPWTIASMQVPRNQKNTGHPAPVSSIAQNMDPFLDIVRPDMLLRTVVLSSHVTIDDIHLSHGSLVANRSPPPCDLEEFLLQYS